MQIFQIFVQAFLVSVTFFLHWIPLLENADFFSITHCTVESESLQSFTPLCVIFALPQSFCKCILLKTYVCFHYLPVVRCVD